MSLALNEIIEERKSKIYQKQLKIDKLYNELREEIEELEYFINKK